MKWKWKYLLWPFSAIDDYNNEKDQEWYDEHGMEQPSSNYVNDVVSDIWNDVTGQTAVNQQNEANKQLAAYQAQMNEEFYNKYSSPQALMNQYQQAGLNPDLMYSGVGSGQGNVPSYSAPSVNRKLSGIEQITRALSLVTGIMNVQNLMYNTVASREIAEQNSVKTLGLVEDVLNKRRNNHVEGNIVGFMPKFDFPGLFKRSALSRLKFEDTSSLPLLERYSDIMRQQRFNNAFKSFMYNAHEYGNYIDSLGDSVIYKPYDDWRANAIWRNKVLEFDSKQRQFTYDWDQDYKTIMKSAGFAGPVLQLVTRLLGGK